MGRAAEEIEEIIRRNRIALIGFYYEPEQKEIETVIELNKLTLDEAVMLKEECGVELHLNDGQVVKVF